MVAAGVQEETAAWQMLDWHVPGWPTEVVHF
jgi:hypothetical protein